MSVPSIFPKNFLIIISLFFLALPLFVIASSTDGTIDSTYKYAWGQNIGWLNFGTSGGNIHIADAALTGYVWSANYGWINLAPAQSGVKNNSEGTLSGYAWGENLGWINFSGVSINSSGQFSGSAIISSDNSAISFDCSNYCAVKTDWRPLSARGGVVEGATNTGGGGGGMPDQWYNGPTPPAGGFRILINNGTPQSDNLIVTLTLFGGPDTAKIIVSNFSDFRDAGQEPYVSTKQWNLCQGLNSCSEGTYVVYAKFYALWGKDSPPFSASIIYKKPSLISRVGEMISSLIPSFLKPKPVVKPPAVVINVPKFAPPPLGGKWNLLPVQAIREFVLAPLPAEFRALAAKLPSLEKTFQQVGISKITDIQKLQNIKMTLPGLTERVGLPTVKIEPGKFALPQGVPIANLPAASKQQMPTEIIFAKTGGQLIDFNPALTLSDKGEPEQAITTIVGKTLLLVIKPDKPVKSIMGYVVFKSKNKQTNMLPVPFSQMAASLIFSEPILAKPQEESVQIEEKLVLQEFEYTDPDGDGIYTAEIQAPVIDGQYEVITVFNYEDIQLGNKSVRLVAVVDPEGYVYEKQGDRETRIPGAIVSLFWLNSETKQYELWPAGDYQQENPQTTDIRGTYSFLVPQGFYYLKVETPGYLAYDGKPFEVTESSGIHINIELKTQYWWLNIIDWKTALIVIVILLLLYNFYKDRMRERFLLRKQN